MNLRINTALLCRIKGDGDQYILELQGLRQAVSDRIRKKLF